MPSRSYACNVCAHEVARQSTHEFCRAKEVFKTTHLAYSTFLKEYIEGVIGFPVSYQSFMAHVNNHVRPALRREMREWEIENARDGEPWAPPTLDDFLVSPEVCKGEMTLSRTQFEFIEDDKGVEPIEDLDEDEYPEAKSLKTRDMDPEEGMGKTSARFWKSHHDDEAQKEHD